MQVSVITTAAQGSGDPTTPQPRLVQAAHEFEAQMMKELMKPMNGGNSLTGEEDDSGSALGEFASEALGRALSEQGGFGIAKSIVKDLSHAGNQKRTVPVTGNMNRDTVIKGLE